MGILKCFIKRINLFKSLMADFDVSVTISNLSTPVIEAITGQPIPGLPSNNIYSVSCL